VQEKIFSGVLANVITRYKNRSIQTAQVMEELIEMAKNNTEQTKLSLRAIEGNSE
jgi:type I restriction enzyme R subunit